MYLPPQFRCADVACARDLMRDHPFAQLISTDSDGLPFVTPLPLHLVAQGDDWRTWRLLGHCAKANPHGRLLQSRPQAVVTFMGPQAYMSPRVYPDLARVPTWNYLMVQCKVEALEVREFENKDHLLKHLIHDHDPAYADQWRALAEDFQHKMAQGITAFELRLTDLQCKLKLNQHRPESHAAMHAAYSQGSPQEQALAEWMVRLGLVAHP